MRQDFQPSFSRGMHRSMLLEPEELKSLCIDNGISSLLYLGKPLDKEEVEISKDGFISLYNDEIKNFFLGKSSPNFICLALLVEKEHFSFLEVGTRIIVRPKVPVIQISFANFFLEKREGKIQEKAFGADNIFWGVKFSFFQLYMDEQQRVHHALTELPSGKIFRNILAWSRVHTKPVTFLYKDKKVLTPLRIGKRVAKINENQYLLREGLQVV